MNEATGHILVVDDNEANRDMLSRRLERKGFEVSVAADGHEALRMVDENRFDLLVLDVMMPGITGLEVLKIVRQTRSVAELPVIMATGRGESEDVVEALKLGANDYVTKPIDFPVLLARVQTQLALRRLSDMKDEFLRIASHDLKSPLQVIQGSASLLQGQSAMGEPMTEDMETLCAMIRRRAVQMQRIISDFLDFQAMEDGRLKIDPAPTDLNAIAKQVVDDNSEYARQKEVGLILELDPNLPPIDADPARMEQVIQNLVGNSIKFSPKGEVTRVRTKMDEGAVLLEICDSGPGLSEDDMKRLFVKYARLANKPTGEEKSSGLGLYICKQMVELHGGQIGARRNADRGATFWLRLPALQPSPAEARVP